MRKFRTLERYNDIPKDTIGEEMTERIIHFVNDTRQFDGIKREWWISIDVVTTNNHIFKEVTDNHDEEFEKIFALEFNTRSSWHESAKNIWNHALTLSKERECVSIAREQAIGELIGFLQRNSTYIIPALRNVNSRAYFETLLAAVKEGK